MTDTYSNPFSYIFNANAKPGEPLSYQALQTRRKIAEALASKRSPFPKTIGEGLVYGSEKLTDAFDLRNLDEQDRLLAARQAQSAAEANKAYETGGTVPSAVSPARTSEAETTPPAMPAAEAPPASPEARNAIASAMVPLPPQRPTYDTTRINAEVQANPDVAARYRSAVQGEASNPQEQRLIAENIRNRALARGTSLADQLKTVPQPGGYYPAATFTRGQAPESTIAGALRGDDEGSRVLGFSPTGNASGSFAEDQLNKGVYHIAGHAPGGTEMFVQQERPAQLDRLAQTRVAALGNTGAGLPGNPPIVQPDIAVAPPAVRTAQVGGIPGPLAPPRSESAPPSVGRVPSVPAETFSQTKPPAPTPIGRDELRAIAMMNSTQDPVIQQQWGGVAAYFKAQRDRTDKLNDEAFKSELERQRTISTKQLEHTLSGPEREARLQKEEREAAAKQKELEQFAGIPVGTRYATAEKQHEKVENLPGQLDALRAARDIVQNQPMFSGGLATQKRALASLFAGLNFTPDARLTPTEQFQALTRHLMGQVRGPVAGPGTASDRDTANMLASIAADPTLQKNTVLRVFDYLDHVAVARATQHQKQMLTLTGSDENTQRLFGQFQLPMTSVLPSSAIQQFNELRRTKGDAAASAIIDKEFHTPGLGGNLIDTRRSVLE